MIKQIQLRGISRTPSDRMSEDGGLSESLNMYLDTAENAPALVPEDVTTELGASADFNFYYAFLHKGNGYENLFYVTEKELGYFKDSKPTKILDLEEGDEVSDISSIGNSVIVKGNLTTYYLLYKEGDYISLGPQVPFPILEISQVDTGVIYDTIEEISIWNVARFNSTYGFNETTDEDEIAIKKKLSAEVLQTYKDKVSSYLSEGHFTTLRFIRYAIELMDGTLISSIPFIVGAFPSILTIDKVYPTESDEPSTHTNNLQGDKYKIKLKLPKQDIFRGWEDIVRKVNIYLSPPIIPDQEEAMIKAYDWNKYETQIPEGYITTREVGLNIGSLFLNAEEVMFYASQCKLIKSILVFEEDTFQKEIYTNDYNQLCDGLEIVASEEYSYTNLVTQESIKDDDIQHYPVLGERYSSFNNRLLSVAPIETISYMYLTLPDAASTSSSGPAYLLQFHLFTDSGEKVVERKVPQGRKYFFFPDARCHQVNVFWDKDGQTLMKSFDMKTYAFLEGAFYLDDSFLFSGQTSLEGSSLSGEPSEPQPINISDERSNYLYASELNNLFIFPDAGKYQFSSKVVGVAVATTALSQGQFGQFPLYVFTEDGIWAMETASDGSFITQKPLSREVCVNPDSICSIDNAVVFVTDKAVMMIQGSQVMNISPYMNGKHYEPNASATELIAKQDGYAELVGPISDSDPFMKFMRDAKVAYDYTGQRLVFISESNKGFQYIYKLDTQTWHKVSFGLSLDFPLNSYPEALVMGKGEMVYMQEYIENDIPFEMTESEAEYILFYIAPQSYDCVTSPSLLKTDNLIAFANGTIAKVDIGGTEKQDFVNSLKAWSAGFEESQIEIKEEERIGEKIVIYDLSTILDASRNQDTAKGILITRPFDLGMPDVYKSITSIKIRGDYDKGNIKYILQGSDDGRNFYTLNSLRGKSWKMFRIFILADLEPTERISWIDVDFEPRYNNKLR